MARLCFIILGVPGSGKSSIGNIILGKKDFQMKMKAKENYTVASTDDKNILVFDTSSTLEKSEFKKLLQVAEAAANKVIVLVVVDAKCSEDITTYLDDLTDSKDIWEKTYLILADSRSPKQTRNSKILDKIMNKFSNRHVAIKLDDKGDMKKQQQMLLEIADTQPNEAYAEKMDTGYEDEEHKKGRSLYITIIGGPGSGKSTTGNTILGEESFETDLYNDKMAKTQSKEVKMKDTQDDVYVTDTSDDLAWASKVFMDKSKLKETARHVLLMTMNVGTRMSPEEKERIKNMRSSFGDANLKEHLYIAFTHGDEFNILLKQDNVQPFDKFIKSHTGPLGSLLELCNYRALLINNCGETTENDKETATELLEMFWKPLK